MLFDMHIYNHLCCVRHVNHPKKQSKYFQPETPPIPYPGTPLTVDDLLQVSTVQGIHHDIPLSKGDDYSSEQVNIIRL